MELFEVNAVHVSTFGDGNRDAVTITPILVSGNPAGAIGGHLQSDDAIDATVSRIVHAARAAGDEAKRKLAGL